MSQSNFRKKYHCTFIYILIKVSSLFTLLFGIETGTNLHRTRKFSLLFDIKFSITIVSFNKDFWLNFTQIEMKIELNANW